jgi:hypothetical protein
LARAVGAKVKEVIESPFWTVATGATGACQYDGRSSVMPRFKLRIASIDSTRVHLRRGQRPVALDPFPRHLAIHRVVAANQEAISPIQARSTSPASWRRTAGDFNVSGIKKNIDLYRAFFGHAQERVGVFLRGMDQTIGYQPHEVQGFVMLRSILDRGIEDEIMKKSAAADFVIDVLDVGAHDPAGAHAQVTHI